VTLADLGGSEINHSPNQAVDGKSSDAVAGADGATVVPAAATAPASPPATDGQDQDADVASVVSTPLVDPFAHITVTRGTQSSQYKVRPER
jgi:hypothetical protein